MDVFKIVAEDEGQVERYVFIIDKEQYETVKSKLNTQAKALKVANIIKRDMGWDSIKVKKITMTLAEFKAAYVKRRDEVDVVAEWHGFGFLVKL